jgi:hypothetical protein
MDQDRHDFTWQQTTDPNALAFAVAQLELLSLGNKLLAKVIDITKKVH